MKPKLTEQEVEQVLRLIARLQEDNDMCTHEALLWMVFEINKFIEYIKEKRERSN